MTQSADDTTLGIAGYIALACPALTALGKSSVKRLSAWTPTLALAGERFVDKIAGFLEQRCKIAGDGAGRSGRSNWRGSRPWCPVTHGTGDSAVAVRKSVKPWPSPRASAARRMTRIPTFDRSASWRRASSHPSFHAAGAVASRAPDKSRTKALFVFSWNLRDLRGRWVLPAAEMPKMADKSDPRSGRKFHRRFTFRARSQKFPVRMCRELARKILI